MAATERALIAEPVASAGGRIIASPFQFYTTGEDRLRLTTVCSVANVVVKMHSRFVDTKGVVQASADTHTPNSDRTVKSTDHELGVGALLNLTVFSGVTFLQRGQCFVIVQLVRGIGPAAIVLGTLLAGYITGTQHLGWPGTPIESSIDGRGALVVVRGTFPAAGAEINESVPTGARWELVSLTAQLIASAVVATRVAVLTITLAAHDLARNYTLPSTLSGETRLICWMRNVQRDGTTVPLLSTGAMPDGLVLPAGTQIHTVTTGLQAGDQYDSPTYLVGELLEVS